MFIRAGIVRPMFIRAGIIRDLVRNLVRNHVRAAHVRATLVRANSPSEPNRAGIHLSQPGLSDLVRAHLSEA
jgi:hypothetical protein